MSSYKKINNNSLYLTKANNYNYDIFDFSFENRIVITSDNKLINRDQNEYTFTANKVDFTGGALVFGTNYVKFE